MVPRKGSCATSAARRLPSVLLLGCDTTTTPYVRGNACIGDNRAGRWVSGGTLDVVGIHAAMLPNGLALLYGYDHLDHVTGENGGRQLWDPSTRAPLTVERTTITNHNPFCAGQSFLGDGRLLVAGGFKTGLESDESTANNVATVAAGARSAEWVEAQTTMSDYRWYPTTVTLADGSTLIMGGSDPSLTDDWDELSEAYELFDVWQNRLIRQEVTGKTFPRDGRFDYPDGDRRRMLEDGARIAGLYPLVHLLPNVAGDDAPDGLLFVLTDSFVRIYNPATNTIVGDKQDARGFRTWPTQGSSVLLPIDIDAEGNPPETVEVMLLGGGTLGRSDATAPALATADIWSYDVTTRVVTNTGSIALQRPRFMGDSLLLPDGNVLLVGGAANTNSDRVRHAELIQPPTATTTGSSMEWLPAGRGHRGYHASALLLPDASVLVTGGTGGWVSGAPSYPPEEHKTVDVFEPPYLSAGSQSGILTGLKRLTSVPSPSAPLALSPQHSAPTATRPRLA